MLLVTIGKEAIDDYGRYKRDVESNSAPYKVLLSSGSTASGSSRREHGDLERSHGARVGMVPSSKLRVGDLVVLEKNQRVPADMVLLRTSAGDHRPSFESPRGGGAAGHHAPSHGDVLDSDDEPGKGESECRSAAHGEDSDGAGGTCFVRTDQLDGETDWKLRVAVDITQRMSEDELVQLGERAVIYGEYWICCPSTRCN